MTIILLHGLLDGAAPATPIFRAETPPHRLAEAGALIAVVSTAPQDLTDPALDPAVLAKAALDHNAILTTYAEQRTVLPVQFGAAFSDDTALQTHLSDRRQIDQATACFERLAHRKEFGLQILLSGSADPVAPVPIAPGGRAFLQARAQKRSARKTVADRRGHFVSDVASGLRSIASDLRFRPARSDRLCDLALLIDRSDIASFADRVAAFSPTAKSLGLDLRMTGPWPAYSFVSETGGLT